MKRVLLGFVLTTLGAPAPASAQFELITNFFKEIDEIRVSMGCWDIDERDGLIERDDKPCPVTTASIGFEVMRSLGTIGLDDGKVVCDGADITVRNFKDGEVCGWKITEIESSGRRQRDTTRTLEPVRASKTGSARRIDFDLGLGFSKFDNFGLSNGVIIRDSIPGDSIQNIEGTDVRGEIREFPSVSVYATFRPFSGLGERFSFLAGLRTGLLTANDVNAFIPQDSTVGDPPLPRRLRRTKGTGQSLTLGLVGGVSTDLVGGRVRASYEAAWMKRRIRTVSWDASPVPGGLPVELDFTGVSHHLSLSVPLSFD